MSIINFVKENPGRQLLTGSFHPVSDGKWTQGAYVDSETGIVGYLSSNA
jgi:hypothetical protein